MGACCCLWALVRGPQSLQSSSRTITGIKKLRKIQQNTTLIAFQYHIRRALDDYWSHGQQHPSKQNNNALLWNWILRDVSSISFNLKTQYPCHTDQRSPIHTRHLESLIMMLAEILEAFTEQPTLKAPEADNESLDPVDNIVSGEMHIEEAMEILEIPMRVIRYEHEDVTNFYNSIVALKKRDTKLLDTLKTMKLINNPVTKHFPVPSKYKSTTSLSQSQDFLRDARELHQQIYDYAKQRMQIQSQADQLMVRNILDGL
ncbi:hypothetical protein ABKN59_003546 [Abortiporus biennis]